MNAPLILTGRLRVPPAKERRRRTDAPAPEGTTGRVPRVARLLALAIKLDAELRTGVVPDFAALARLGHVSRARISQIMNLLCLAPDIQEEILFLQPVQHGRDPIHLRQLQCIALTAKWPKQRILWKQLKAVTGAISTI